VPLELRGPTSQLLQTTIELGYYNILDLGGVWLQGLKFSWCHIGCYMRCRMRCSDTNKKNKLQIQSVNRETNLLRLINLSLAHVTVAPHCQIMD
jgi:hypothetical protein